MNSNSKFNLKKQFKSIHFALSGISYALKHEPKLYLHFIVQICTIFLGYFFNISSFEWLILILILGVMFSTELLNTAIEELCDKININIDPKIKIIKDLSAAAVFFIACIGAVLGFVIFIPKFLALF